MPKKPTKKSSKSTTRSSVSTYWKVGLSVVAVAMVSIILIYDLVIGGNIYMYAKWVDCGRKPVVQGMTFGVISYYKDPSMVDLIQGTAYCTPLDAEKAGLSDNPYRYETPHLDAENGVR